MLKGPAKRVKKAEQMLEELLSSAVEISVSGEEKAALLSGTGSGKKNERILDKINEMISVPIKFKGKQTIVMFGKPEETKVAKEIFEEKLRMVKKVLSTI